MGSRRGRAARSRRGAGSRRGPLALRGSRGAASERRVGGALCGGARRLRTRPSRRVAFGRRVGGMLCGGGRRFCAARGGGAGAARPAGIAGGGLRALRRCGSTPGRRAAGVVRPAGNEWPSGAASVGRCAVGLGAFVRRVAFGRRVGGGRRLCTACGGGGVFKGCEISGWRGGCRAGGPGLVGGLGGRGPGRERGGGAYHDLRKPATALYRHSGLNAACWDITAACATYPWNMLETFPRHCESL